LRPCSLCRATGGALHGRGLIPVGLSRMPHTTHQSILGVTDTTLSPIGTIDHQGHPVMVHCRIEFDGVEFIGRLWFGPDDGTEPTLPDRAAIPGRSHGDVLSYARQLTPQELHVRHRRAMSDKRRYKSLRTATEEIIAKIRYMNRLAISMRKGVIDADGAAQELYLTERQMIEVVQRLKDYAGLEG
jgi:hypothetical protein